MCLLASPPLAAELEGAPPERITLPAAPAKGVLPPDWYLDSGRLSSTDFAAWLFDASAAGPVGAPFGRVCEVTLPDKFPLAAVRLTTQGFPHEVFSTSQWIFLPAVVTTPLRLAVSRDETHDKNVVGELFLAVMTVGMSLPRLNPTHLATLNLPVGATRAKAGAFATQCRVVGRASLEEAIATATKSEKPCSSLPCLRAAAALRGPQDPEVVSRAQALVDDDAAVAQRWRQQATWRLRSFTIERVQHCGPRCVELTVRNETNFHIEIPFTDRVLDAGGRTVIWYYQGFDRSLRPHARRTIRAKVSLEESDGAPLFPLVVRLNEDRWYAAVPGAVSVEGDWFEFGPSRCVAGGKCALPARQRRYREGPASPDRVLFAGGRHAGLSLPFDFFRVRPELQSGEATAHPSSGCPPVVAVSGPTRDEVSFLVP